MTDKFPTWRYGPKGEAAVFESEADVPTGWLDHPSKHKGTSAPAKTESKSAGGEAGTLDAHGHPFNPELHAATQSQTKAGLWRMKVGVNRPDPAPGYPLDL